MLPDEQSPELNTWAVPLLNSLLHAELQAVATYRVAVSAFAEEKERETLQANAENHQRRAELLRREIEVLGGTPDAEDSTWAYFSRPAEEHDASEALSALVEGEDANRDRYVESLDSLTGELRALVESQLLPEQQRTCQSILRLKRRVFH